MAFSLHGLCVFACFVIASGMPRGTLNLQDNSISQDLNDKHDRYLKFEPAEKESSCKGNETEDDDLLPFPLHASCRVEWTFGVECETVSARLVKQMELWTGSENCEGGGEKCLYKLKSQSKNLLRGSHATPVQMYVDNFGFRFKTTDYGCFSKSYSYSTVPYAVLDFGTNYCNLFNLVDGSDLNKEPGFSEKTCDKICTQYTSADCEVY